MMITLPHDSRRLRVLRAPLVTTSDLDRAKRSRYNWRLNADGTASLSTLGILSATVGLVIEVREP